MLLYAETHYPRYWLSRIRRAEPEIVVDIPWRVEPGAGIPVLLLVHHANRYPVLLESVSVTVNAGTSGCTTAEFPLHTAISTQYWWKLLTLPPLAAGTTAEIVPVIRYSVKGRSREMVADNYRGTSHQPFRVHVAQEPYPLPAGWYAGDVHVHTEFTRDQIEFGPPIAALATIAQAMGLHWFCATDHSYDLDDREDDFLRNDPAFPRWNRMLRDCEVPREHFCVIPGEEVSCGNAEGRNVHLLALGIHEHIPGKGDSAERPFRNRPDHSITEVIDLVQRQGGLALAAHPGFTPPRIQRLVFRRGVWKPDDLAREGLAGIQAGGRFSDAGFRRGMEQWVRLLLAGKHVCVVAGNDSHGAFGRTRQVKIPWWSIAEDSSYVFGDVRTVVRADSLSNHHLLDSIAAGRCYITNGPAIRLDVSRGTTRAGMGEELAGGNVTVHVEAESTREWGYVDRIGIAVGQTGGVESMTWKKPENPALRFGVDVDVPALSEGYVRVEAHTDMRRHAYSNPVWITAPA